MINKTDMLADIERVLVPEADIHARIKEVGAQIGRRLPRQMPDPRRRSERRCAVLRRDGRRHRYPRPGGFHVRHVV